jgi:K+-transporting ATPase ATPase A chain
MSAFDLLRVGLYFALTLLLARPIGLYMARVLGEGRTPFARVLAPLEGALYRVCGVDPKRSMNWRAYALAMLAFQLAGFAALYALLRFQGHLPLNPQGFANVPAALAFNTAVSFVTNTNWQAYGGETTLSYLSQAVGLGVQNFVSAATGIAILVAVTRGFAARSSQQLGNFWVDMVRTTLYVLLPLALVVAVALVSQGVVQSWSAYISSTTLEDAAQRWIALGPAASQVAIKQLGTNGGGFFGVNSAHPFENPTPLSNAIELVSILLLPAACCFMFGRMVADSRQGRSLLAAMALLVAPLTLFAVHAETAHVDARTTAVAETRSSFDHAGGSMEGKEVRFGPAESAIWATWTTAASNGSVNSMHDSMTPLGGAAALFLMLLGEVAFGGVGSGLYGMLLFAVVTVFLAGLMVGRTPEYLGKKIQSYEMQMASLAILAPTAVVLLGTAFAVLSPSTLASLQDRGPHGFSEMLYAFASAGNNNGSAFAGLAANTPVLNFALGLAMLVGRYLVAVPVLAIAGALAAKTPVTAGPGTFPTHGVTFVILLTGSVLLVGALSFVPALALGPVVEFLGMN